MNWGGIMSKIIYDYIKKYWNITLIMFLSVFLYTFDLWNLGYANQYYSAAVYSMGQNFHAFLYNSLDSVGYISLDKPPLGFWIQVLSTKIFGFSGFSILLPQALAGVISVFLIYRIIYKRFGNMPACFSALVLAVTPIFVAVCRNNTIDSLLIMVLLLVSEFTLKSIEKNKPCYFIIAGLLIGIGFNIKMLQAYMIVPAVYFTYIFCSKQKLIKKLLSVLLCLFVTIITSFSWITFVDLTPANQRPYVGSSKTNSECDLAFNYNGLQRVSETIVGDQQQSNEKQSSISQDNNTNTSNVYSMIPQMENPLALGKQSIYEKSLSEAGQPSILRWLYYFNAGQISWFIPASLIFMVLAIIYLIRNKIRKRELNPTIVYFLSAFIPMLLYYTFALGFTHRYYYATFAPFIAGMIGIGIYILKQESKSNKILTVITLYITILSQVYIQYVSCWLPIIMYIIIAVLIVTAIIFSIVIIKKGLKKSLSLLLIPLFIFPTIWSASTIYYGDRTDLPITGSELLIYKMSKNAEMDINYDYLIKYLKDNRDNATYILSTPSSLELGSNIILKSGEPVMCIGGFDAMDKPLTVDEYKSLCKNGVVKYAFVDDLTDSEITEWIQKNGELIDCNDTGMLLGGYNIYKVS